MNLLQVILFAFICFHFESVVPASVHRGNGYQGGHRGGVSQGANFKKTTYQVSNYEGRNFQVGSYQGGSNYNKGCENNCRQGGGGQAGIRVDAGLQGVFEALGNIATSVGTMANKIIKDKINGIFANCIIYKG